MKPTLNLASRTYFNRRALQGAAMLTIALLSLLLAVGAGLALQAFSRQGDLRAALGEIRRELRNVRGQEPALADPLRRRQLAAEVEQANRILARDSFRWTELLDRLEETVPPGVSIRALKPDFNESTLHVEGWTREVEDLREFLDRLLTSSYFRDVYLLSQARQERDGQEGNLVAFSLVVRGAFQP